MRTLVFAALTGAVVALSATAPASAMPVSGAASLGEAIKVVDVTQDVQYYRRYHRWHRGGYYRPWRHRYRYWRRW